MFLLVMSADNLKQTVCTQIRSHLIRVQTFFISMLFLIFFLNNFERKHQTAKNHEKFTEHAELLQTVNLDQLAYDYETDRIHSA